MKIIKIFPVIIFCLLSYFLYWKISNIEETKELSSAMLNQDFPKLDLEVISGNSPFSKLVGEQEFIVNYFASWCAPCRQEHAILEKMSNNNIIIGIAYKDSKKNVKNFISELGNPYETIMMDKNGRAAIELGLYGVPETYFINNKGKIKFRHVGPLTIEKFNNIISLLSK
jgi:cytochrome c biogenesis protein CcmG/thiol:disulfide interchange protein DsbE